MQDDSRTPMTRKQRITFFSAAVALFTATIGGLESLEMGKVALGWFSVAASSVGWLILIWKLRRLTHQPPA